MQRSFELAVPSLVNYIKDFLKFAPVISKPDRDVTLCFQKHPYKNPIPGTSLSSILLSTLASGSKKFIAQSTPFQSVSDLTTLLVARDISNSIEKNQFIFFHQLQLTSTTYIRYAQ
jgi:hypothetical protein